MPSRKRNCVGKFFSQFAVFTLAISIIILFVLCLTGSTYTNPHIPAIFLAQIQKSNTSILIGFYGICTDPTSSSPTCTATVSRSADTIAATLFPNQDQTTSPNLTSLVSFALGLQRKILFSPLPVAAGLFLLGLLLAALTRLIARRQRHLIPSRRLRYLKTFALGLIWLNTLAALMAAALAMEGVNGLVYIVSNAGDGDLNATAGGLLQVLLWVVFGVEVGFSLALMWCLRDGMGGWDDEGVRGVDFERGWNQFEDDHIIII